MTASEDLERRYRRLLRAYPGGYRRVHGDEILATLMDCAEPGRSRPARADVADLARGALRQWFRLPVGVTALVAAVLAAAILGSLGAATGSWLAWGTTAELPPDRVALRTTQTVTGSTLTAPQVDRHDGWRVDWRTVQVTNQDPRGFPGWAPEAAQARLRDEGWTIGPGGRLGAGESDHAVEMFQATREGHILTVDAYIPVIPDGSGTTIAAHFTQVPPVWEPAAILLGWLLGAVTGWILTGWAGYRLRARSSLLQATAVVLGVVALWSAVDPTTDLYVALGRLAFADPGVVPAYPSYGSVLGHPRQVALTLALAVTILALAAVGARRPSRPTAAVA
jgi:hypothetical protein